jgi:hypothetical protein
MVAAGQALVEEGRGALGRTLAAIHSDLPAPAAPTRASAGVAG